MSALVCTRCGNRNAENSRFCSNCGAPLRAGAVPERASETTSTISISGLEAYDAEVTGQTAMPALSRGAGGGRRAAARLGAPGRAPRSELRQPFPAGR